jgi:hypothetical protein
MSVCAVQSNTLLALSKPTTVFKPILTQGWRPAVRSGLAPVRSLLQEPHSHRRPIHCECQGGGTVSWRRK